MFVDFSLSKIVRSFIRLHQTYHQVILDLCHEHQLQYEAITKDQRMLQQLRRSAAVHLCAAAQRQSAVNASRGAACQRDFQSGAVGVGHHLASSKNS